MSNQELNMDQLAQIDGGLWQRVAIRFAARRAAKTVAFYSGLAGGLSGGADFQKAAHEAGKKSGILDAYDPETLPGQGEPNDRQFY